jgi:hypothetical protein
MQRFSDSSVVRRKSSDSSLLKKKYSFPLAAVLGAPSSTHKSSTLSLALEVFFSTHKDH